MKRLKKDENKMYLASAIVSICGIIYQVLYGGVGSYLLGNSILSYSLSIGLSLSGMGIGSLYSEKIKENLMNQFIGIEYIIAIVGGFSSFSLFMSSALLGQTNTMFILCFIMFVTGALTGVELPVLIRKANEKGQALERSTAMVLFSDYSGSLVGTLFFALFLQPKLGFIKTGFLVAMVNVIVALWLSYSFQKELKRPRMNKLIGFALSFVLMFGFLVGETYANGFEQKLYRDPIVISKTTKYQVIKGTKSPGDFRLYQNGQLQFAESDEHRYHESLVHPAMSVATDRINKPLNVIIFGGGDGIATREIIKYKNINSITMVDLDPGMIELARTNPHITRINEGALNNEKLTIINKDAYKYIAASDKVFDVAIVDLPDPDNEALNKLYTKEFYSLIRNHLSMRGVMAIQSTSPVFATKAYWTISKTVESIGLSVDNYHVDVPSFGNWGFVMASRIPIEKNKIKIKVDTQYLSTEMLPSLFYFGKDEDSVIEEKGKLIKLEINTLNRPILHHHYTKAWKYY